MSTRKHVDKLFQEKLQDFEATPSDAVWENISARMELEKKDKKVVPLWLKITGIAAGIVLLITLSNSVFNSDNVSVPENEIVDTKNDTSNGTQENSTNSNNAEDLNQQNNESVVASENENQENSSSQDALNGNNDDSSRSNSEVSGQSKALQTVNGQNRSNVVSNGTQRSTNETSSETQNQKEKSLITNSDQKQKGNAVVNQQELNSPKQPIEEQDRSNTPLEKEQANELIKSNTGTKDSNAVATTSEENTKEDAVNNEEKEEGTSILEELEKADAEKEVLEDKEKMKRWSVSPNVAPVYFNSFGSGSAIDSKFDGNKTTGEINMSYGVAANYKVNEKLSIRAGVNQVNLGYRINNVIVYNNAEPVDNGKPLRNVALNEASQSLSFLSSEGLSFAQVPDVVANNISSSIDQQLGFIEVPIEAEYTLSDKTFGVSVIGGFSTLFLSENEVYSSLQGERQLLGEATNVNKTSFSANLGVGFKYKVSDKINLNLEPVFKYQLNTFSDTSGSFNPYTIGVHTGLSFKF